jgi:hypothetical protein
MVDTATAEATLGEYFCAIFRTKEMVGGDADVVVFDVVVVTRLGHDLDAWSIAGDNVHPVCTHDEEDVGHAPSAGEPLFAVDDPLIAILYCGRLEQVRIRATLGLCH